MMLDNVALSFICAANRNSFAKWFACLGEIINHPLLHEEEKYLGLWLAIQSTKNESFTCSFKLNLQPKPLFRKENKNALVLPYIRNNQQIKINLIKRYEPIEKKKGVIKRKKQPLDFFNDSSLLKNHFNIIAKYFCFKRKR